MGIYEKRLENNLRDFKFGKKQRKEKKNSDGFDELHYFFWGVKLFTIYKTVLNCDGNLIIKGYMTSRS